MPVHLWPSGQVCKRVSQTGGQRSGSSQGAAVVSVVSVVVGAAAVVGVASVVLVLVPAVVLVLAVVVLVPAVLVLVLGSSASGRVQARVSRSRSGARVTEAAAQ